jgi:hypothetical protein
MIYNIYATLIVAGQQEVQCCALLRFLLMLYCDSGDLNNFTTYSKGKVVPVLN